MSIVVRPNKCYILTITCHILIRAYVYIYIYSCNFFLNIYKPEKSGQIPPCIIASSIRILAFANVKFPITVIIGNGYAHSAYQVGNERFGGIFGGIL